MRIFRPGFGRWLRRMAPKGLYWRTLLIFLLPIALMQIAIVYIFFDTHWERTADRLAQSAAGDAALVVALWENTASTEARGALAAKLTETKSMEVAPAASATPQAKGLRILADPIDRRFISALDGALEGRTYDFVADAGAKSVLLRIDLTTGPIEMRIDRSATVPTRGYQFLIAVIASTIVLMAVSIAFIRNQIRPIERLAQAAEAFGRGADAPEFKPRGAREVRRAALAVLEMRDRISRHVDQRTLMLAGVSHDLRTPITRLKLQLALMPQSPDRDAITADLTDMERTLREYLDFAHGAGTSAPQAVDIDTMVDAAVVAVEPMRRADQSLSRAPPAEPVTLMLREQAVRRALTNLLENALRHARRVEVSVEADARHVELLVDDDGPGIPPAQREEAFRPFTQLNADPTVNRRTFGLGLAIARDVARAHGGDVFLETAALGGLRARFRLPR
jgi:two-component system, OmpR family, osmolarity sensor histidine kinase EnvZ